MPITIRGAHLRIDTTRLVTAQTMRAVGDRTVQEIEERTHAGQDTDGRAFAPYSDGYTRAKYRYKSGLRKGRRDPGWKFGQRLNRINPNKVDLTLTGQMLNEMGVTAVSKARCVVGFRTARAAERASYHMGEGRVDREFFGVSDRLLDTLRQIVADRMEV